MRMTYVSMPIVVALVAGACAERRQHSYASHPSRDAVVTSQTATDFADNARQIVPSRNYPLKACVVSWEPLRPFGSVPRPMDGPVAVVYDGTEVQLCCSACLDDFNRDPAKYVALVRDARR